LKNVLKVGLLKKIIKKREKFNTITLFSRLSIAFGTSAILF